tara:strand:- start:63 stop:263 length:201 start_codon:yes stop_codon:yes gene_type:complete
MSTIYQDITKHLNVEVEALKESLALGAPNDYSEYQMIVGRIRGIQWAAENVREFIRSSLDEIDEDN